MMILPAQAVFPSGLLLDARTKAIADGSPALVSWYGAVEPAAHMRLAVPVDADPVLVDAETPILDRIVRFGHPGGVKGEPDQRSEDYKKPNSHRAPFHVGFCFHVSSGFKSKMLGPHLATVAALTVIFQPEGGESIMCSSTRLLSCRKILEVLLAPRPLFLQAIIAKIPKITCYSQEMTHHHHHGQSGDECFGPLVTFSQRLSEVLHLGP